jgi:homospermidine synthase
MADHESLSGHRVRSPEPVAGLEPTAGLQVTGGRQTARPFGIYIPNGPGACPSAAGIVEADEIDFARCLQLQRPFRNVLVR